MIKIVAIYLYRIYFNLSAFRFKIAPLSDDKHDFNDCNGITFCKAHKCSYVSQKLLLDTVSFLLANCNYYYYY